MHFGSSFWTDLVAIFTILLYTMRSMQLLGIWSSFHVYTVNEPDSHSLSIPLHVSSLQPLLYDSWTDEPFAFIHVCIESSQTTKVPQALYPVDTNPSSHLH